MMDKSKIIDRCKNSRMILLGIIFITVIINSCSLKPKVYHVGILSGLDFFANTVDGFKEKMTELGYIEGKNIFYDLQKTQFDPSVEQGILKKFVADKVDLILTFPTDASLQAKAIIEGTKIPLVFTNANIEGVHLINTIPEPGGNITGVRYPGPDLAMKRFEILKRIVPDAKQILVFYQRGYPIVSSQLEALRPAAVSAGIVLIEEPADNANEIQVILQKEIKANDISIDAVLIISEPLCVEPDAFMVIGKFAGDNKIPIGGALMSVGSYESIFGVSTNSIAVGRQAAILADKIFKGTPAGKIMVVSAESYLQINYRAAQKLGLNINDSLLSIANEIIR